MKLFFAAPAALSLFFGLMQTAPAAAQTCEPVQACGDVDNSGSIVTTDALKVLRKSVGQNVPLICQCSDNGNTCAGELDACEDDLADCGGDLTSCNGSLMSCGENLAGCNENLDVLGDELEQCLFNPKCGNGILDDGEQCDIGTTANLFCLEAGTLRCGPGCVVDLSGCFPSRFDTSGATIIDHDTGLEWEKKDSANGIADLFNVHDLDNTYTWADFGTIPNGGLFEDFLLRLNIPTGAGASSATGATATGCYGNHCDWRMPTIAELSGLLRGTPGNCVNPCIFPEFSPAVAGTYWSLSTNSSNLNQAWRMNVATGTSGVDLKTLSFRALAVRGGA